MWFQLINCKSFIIERMWNEDSGMNYSEWWGDPFHSMYSEIRQPFLWEKAQVGLIILNCYPILIWKEASLNRMEHFWEKITFTGYNLSRMSCFIYLYNTAYYFISTTIHNSLPENQILYFIPDSFYHEWTKAYFLAFSWHHVILTTRYIFIR